MDLPDFVKESVAQIQILCTFQARAVKGRRVWRETRALGVPCGARQRGVPLTESDFCLRGPSPQNLHN